MAHLPSRLYGAGLTTNESLMTVGASESVELIVIQSPNKRSVALRGWHVSRCTGNLLSRAMKIDRPSSDQRIASSFFGSSRILFRVSDKGINVVVSFGVALARSESV